MRAGKRKHLIVIQEGAESLNDAGTPAFVWSDKVSLRAEILREDTTEFMRASGASDETVIVFRTLWSGAISTTDRVKHGDRLFNIRELVPTYHQFEVELRCVAFSEGV